MAPAAARRPVVGHRPVTVTPADLRTARLAGSLDFVVHGAVVDRPALPALTSQVADVLSADGVWLGAVARGEPHRQALVVAAAQHQLRVTFVAAPPAADHRWFMAGRTSVPGRPVLDLGLSSWMTLLAGQAGDAGPLPARCGMI
jgi:hypothetical protein